jgi:putative ABC transport system permease protein
MKFANWLLSVTLRDGAEYDMVVGDLREELPSRGRLWYSAQAISIAAHAIGRRRAEASQRRRGDFFMRTLFTDIRYGWRALAKRPLLTLTVAATLALALGANAAVFNVIDRIVLRPYPLPDPDTAVVIAETAPNLEFKEGSVAPGNFLDWRRETRTLDRLAAYEWWDANLADRNQPERLAGYHVTSGLFEALGVRAALGRTLIRDDETFGRHHVVVISDELWKRRFDADPRIVGRSVLLDGLPHEIVGVMPSRFSFPNGAEIWGALAYDPKTAPSRTDRSLTAIGHLKPGSTIEDTRAELSLMAARLARDYPDANRDHGVHVYTMTEGMLGEGNGPILGLWQVSAVLVLLIACANIANLLLARAAERRRETAVRLALGASRWRIARELLTESVLLALLAVPGAIGFAWVGLHLMRVNMPANILRFVPGFESLGPDLRLLAFTVGLAIVTAGVFGLLPAIQTARAPVADTLKEGGRTATGRQFLRRAIVVAQMSIALPLLVAAGLGVAGAYRFLNGPQGYDPDGLLTMKLVLPERTYPDKAAQRQFVLKAMDKLNAIPGVDRAVAINDMPASESNSSRGIEIDGHPPNDPKNLPRVDFRVETPGYFSALRIPLLEGRDFTDLDREDTAPVVIVSASMARKYWPNEDPVGRRMRVKDGPWLTVVGVAGDVIHDWFNRRNSPTIYRPIRQEPSDFLCVVIRAQGDPTALAQDARQAFVSIDPQQPVYEMMTMRRALHERTIGLQYLATLMATFAGMALVLAVVGLYAVIAYLVAQRRHEIGVRIALGASGVDIVRMTMAQALRLALVGTAIGLAIALALSRVIESALMGIGTGRVQALAGFPAALIACALVAGYLPARRAAAIDPMIALRTE